MQPRCRKESKGLLSYKVSLQGVMPHGSWKVERCERIWKARVEVEDREARGRGGRGPSWSRARMLRAPVSGKPPASLLVVSSGSRPSTTACPACFVVFLVTLG